MIAPLAARACLLLVFALARPARAMATEGPPPGTTAELPEAPADASDEADVVFERAGTDSAGIEVAFGLRGAGRGAPRRARTLRFLGDGLEGVVRDGADDPLAGAEVGGSSANRSWRVGRSAPQWGCGWLVGAPRVPWGEARAGEPFGLRGGPRGDVATFALGESPGLEAMLGRFAGRDVAAVRAGMRGVGLVIAGSRRGLLGLGVVTSLEGLATELAFDRAGRWRGETVAARGLGGGRVALRARAGSAGFRPLLAPARGGPAAALAAEWSGGEARVRPRALAALWRFGSGVDGGRGRLEVDLRLAHHAAWTLGCEEQRGTRRDRAARGLRQGWWGEWRGGSGPLGLTLGLENWGRRSRARGSVRGSSFAAIQWRTPLGGWLRAEQRAYRSGSGEGLRVPDFESDRLVLRALSGAGERTRIELMAPGPAGRVRAGWTFNATASRPARTQWTLDWTRRSRIGGVTP